MLTAAAHTQKLSPKPVTSNFLHCYCPIISRLHIWTGQLNSLSIGLSAFIQNLHFVLFKEVTPKSQIRSCHFSTLNSLIASPFIIKLKTPSLVYQVLYDLTTGPLSHLLYSLLMFCWLYFTALGLLHSPLRCWEHVLLPSKESAVPWIHSGPYSSVTSSMRASPTPYSQWRPCHPVCFSFNSTHRQLALHNWRDTWLIMAWSSASGPWKKDIPRRGEEACDAWVSVHRTPETVD